MEQTVVFTLTWKPGYDDPVLMGIYTTYDRASENRARLVNSEQEYDASDLVIDSMVLDQDVDSD